MLKKAFPIILVGLFILIFPLTTLAQTEGVPIQKDVYLNWPILGVEDLPNQVTVSLYDSETAFTALATQTFPRGNYTLDFEFNKSDGVALGPIARLNVNFANKLDMGDDPDNPNRVKELWTEVKIDGEAVGNRTKVSDEALVKLLLASDASIATYLTLAYEGDDNPIATIYKDLPLASSSEASANDYINSLFRTSSTVDGTRDVTDPNNWYPNTAGDGIYYSYGSRLGIGTTTPELGLDICDIASWGTPLWINASGLTGGKKWSIQATGGTHGNGQGLLLFRNETDSKNVMSFSSSSVGVGTFINTYDFAVDGSIGCRELTVTTTGWADFVFEESYKLPSLTEVAEFISENKHLPGIPSETQVKGNGINVGEISSKLLQKIEELTLYMIDLKKENESLKGQIKSIQNQISQENR